MPCYKSETTNKYLRKWCFNWFANGSDKHIPFLVAVAKKVLTEIMSVDDEGNTFVGICCL